MHLTKFIYLRTHLAISIIQEIKVINTHLNPIPNTDQDITENLKLSKRKDPEDSFLHSK